MRWCQLGRSEAIILDPDKMADLTRLDTLPHVNNSYPAALTPTRKLLIGSDRVGKAAQTFVADCRWRR